MMEEISGGRVIRVSDPYPFEAHDPIRQAFKAQEKLEKIREIVDDDTIWYKVKMIQAVLDE